MESEVIQKMIEQHTNHARHVEVERMWYGTLYTAVLGAVFLTMEGGFTQKSMEATFVVVFLMILAVIGILLSLKLWLIFDARMRSANQLLNYLVKNNYENSDEILKLNKFAFKRSPIRQIRVSMLFPAFYLINLCGLTLLLLRQLGVSEVHYVILVIIIYMTIIGLLWKKTNLNKMKLDRR